MPMSGRLLRPRASASTAFDPRVLSRLAIWYDALDASTVILNGGNVSQWLDKSGNGRHASQATAASQPQYSAAGPFPAAVVCPSPSRWLSISGAGGVARNVSGVTLIGVHRPTTASVLQSIFFLSRGDVITSPRAVIAAGVTSGSLESGGRRLDANSIQTVFSPYVVDTPYVHVGVLNYSAATLSHYVNGSLANSSSSFQTAGLSENNDSLAANLFTNGASGLYQGAGAEFVAYSRALSASEVSAISRYLGAKWGVAVA